MSATAMPARPAPRSAGSFPPGPIPAPSEVTGLVLCGGESRRMGSDKALVELDGRPMIAHSIEALAPVARRILLATGAAPRYPELGLDTVVDPVADAGPLAGLLAGLEGARTEWVAVLACDMPRARVGALQELLAEALRRDLDVCLAALPRGTQPLLAIYRRRCAPAVKAALAAGERRMVGFHHYPAEGRALRVGSLHLRDEDAALNVNTQVELAAEVARERKDRA